MIRVVEEEETLPSSLFIVRTPSGVRTRRIVACPTPIPLAAITQEYIYSQHLLNPDDNPASPRKLHL